MGSILEEIDVVNDQLTQHLEGESLKRLIKAILMARGRLLMSPESFAGVRYRILEDRGVANWMRPMFIQNPLPLEEEVRLLNELLVIRARGQDFPTFNLLAHLFINGNLEIPDDIYAEVMNWYKEADFNSALIQDAPSSEATRRAIEAPPPQWGLEDLQASGADVTGRRHMGTVALGPYGSDEIGAREGGDWVVYRGGARAGGPGAEGASLGALRGFRRDLLAARTYGEAQGADVDEIEEALYQEDQERMRALRPPEVIIPPSWYRTQAEESGEMVNSDQFALMYTPKYQEDLRVRIEQQRRMRMYKERQRKRRRMGLVPDFNYHDPDEPDYQYSDPEDFGEEEEDEGPREVD